MRTVIAIGAVLLSVCCAAQPEATLDDWEVVYEAHVLPADAGWGGGDSENTLVELTDEGLRIVDEGTERGELRFFQRNWPARPERGGEVEVTMRAVHCDGRSANSVLIADGVHEECVTFYPDRVELNNSGLTHEMDTTDAFHTYRIRISGISIQLWVDDTLAIDGMGAFTHEAHSGRQLVGFGSISSRQTGEGYWKRLRLTSWREPVELWPEAEHVEIYRKEGVYACFPSLQLLEDGRLYTSFGTRVRRSHIDNTGGSARAISADGGYTWELTEETFTPTRRVREDGAIITPHARGWVRVPEEQLPEIKEAGRKWRHVREGVVAYLGDPRVRIEHPDKEDELIEFDSPVPGGTMGFHMASSFLRSGDLWMTAVYSFLGHEQPNGVWAIRSEDNGETWDVVEVARPLGDRISFGESALCENDIGEIICMMRTSPAGKYNTFQTFSSDGGRTWSPPQDSGIWGYPCNVIHLDDGRLLCSYGYRRDPIGIRAVLSDDGGHTWDLENEIILRADGHGAGGDNGYPISVELDDGDIFTIYYLNDEDNVTHIAGTRWTPPASE